MFRDRSIQGFLKRLLQSHRKQLARLLALAVALLCTFEVGSSNSAKACKTLSASAMAEARVHATTRAGQAVFMPARAEIVDAGFRAVTIAQQERSLETTHLWLKLREVPAAARFVVLESVWGAGPDSLSTMWGRALPIRNQHVFAYPDGVRRYRDQPFTIGFRLRYILEDGSMSEPSLPIFVNHVGSEKSHDGLRADQVAMGICCAVLFLFWCAYRRSSNCDGRIRVSALLALSSLLFLAISPALPWMSVDDPDHRYDSVDCHLGDEVQCATYAPDSGPNPVSRADVSKDRRFEISRWVHASSSLRGSLILCLVLLLPALIWILLAPGLRFAQSTILLGSSAAGYCFLSALFYRLSMPSWMSVQNYHTFDLTLLTTMTILLSCGLIFFWSFFGRTALHGATYLPSATVRKL